MRRRRIWPWLGALLGVTLVSAAQPTARAWREHRRKAKLKSLYFAPPNSYEFFEVERIPEPEGEGEEGERDDATLRRIANRALLGDPPVEAIEEWTRIADLERRKWAHLMPGAPLRAPLAGDVWVNLGPDDGVFNLSSDVIEKVDSGRPTAIGVHPTNPEIVYLATAGGGVWKTYDFVSGAPNPTWRPITETLGSLAVGAMAIDPNQPDTIYVGLGDPFDVDGNAVYRSDDGGGTWSSPVFLSGAYGNFAVKPTSIRELKVDPTDSNHVLAATSHGLFRSKDGGRTFALVDLPNAAANELPEAIWDIVFLGTQGGRSHWLVSGVQACEPRVAPPSPAMATSAGNTSWETGRPCTHGNQGHLWRSSDSGESWTSIRDAGGLPVAGSRISIAAGRTTDPSKTVVYAYVGSETEYPGRTVGFFRSTDGGRTFVDVSGTLINPTPSGQCSDWPNLGHDQSWYNQAIAVDPTDENNVIAGGNLCGVRTRNGLSSAVVWENVSHWFPDWGGDVQGGKLPYVHADWHTALVAVIGGRVRVLVGSDGGLFTSIDAFTAPPTQVSWDFHNRGLVTHLCYSIGSGDPAHGNAYVALTGLQDNGTRFRDQPRWKGNTAYDVGDVAGPTSPNGHLYRVIVAGKSGGTEPAWVTTSGGLVPDGTVVWQEIGPMRATRFNEILGGDGIGAAVNKGTSGEWIWASAQYTRMYCNASKSDCNVGTSWIERGPPIGGNDEDPFMIRYSPIQTDPTGGAFLTATNLAVWKSAVTTCTGAETVDCCPVGTPVPCWRKVGPNQQGYVRNVFASQTIPRLYGAVLSGGTFSVTSDEATWTRSSPLGFNGETLYYATSIAFPPTTPAGKNPGDVYVAASAAPVTASNQPVPEWLGRIFITEDRGATWKPIHGNGTGQDLPNVPILVVRYDPGDATNRTIYVGTHIGLYRTTDGGQTWHRFGHGLPLVRVDDIFISKSSSLMRIATYGRGLWEIYPSTNAPQGVPGDGDFDRNLVIDFRDLGALASRLGTTPATTSWPRYHWISDLTNEGVPGGTSHIDEKDLERLLAKFGGHP